MIELKKTSRFINRIIIHCSATAEGKDFTVQDIDRWHRERGFECIGYHYVIYRDGTIHEGRSINKVGAHCTGKNTGSIGICYIGGLAADGKTAKDTRTPEQRKALDWLVAQLREMYHGASVHGHNEFAKKACPSFNVRKEFAILLLFILSMVSTSCRTQIIRTEYVTQHDTISCAVTNRDSIHVHDSIQVQVMTQADTVYVTKEKWHTRYQDRIQHDSIYISRTDTCYVQRTEDKKMSIVEQACAVFGTIGMIFIAVFLFSWLVDLALKRMTKK